MNLIIRLLLTALAVVVLAKILPGVSVEGYGSAIIVAIVIALLRLLVKPILVLLTLPITVVTFGLFILIINAIIILIADYFVGGFDVVSIWWALLFSLLLSLFQSILFSLLKEDKSLAEQQFVNVCWVVQKAVFLHPEIQKRKNEHYKKRH